jgi:hypothetical protein
MSSRSCTAILAIAVGISTISIAQAAQIENGITVNGFAVNGITVNGLSANGLSIDGNEVHRRLHEVSSGTASPKAVILRDGSMIDLR